MKKTLFSILFLYQIISFSQDTISVYFDVNKSVLKSNQKPLLDSLPILYSDITIDSVYYIGMTDSVGNVESNLTLSQQRAKTVKEYCDFFFSNSTPNSTFALGEKSKNDLSQNRRVDIIIFYQLDDIDGNPLVKCKNLKGKPPCFKIEYNIINNCSVSEVKKGRRTFIKLENNLHDSLFSKRHYSGSLRGENFSYRRVKWKTKTTGKLWWRKERKVALILKEDYQKFKIFRIVKDTNCEGCNEDLSKNLKIESETTCKKVEYNVMTNSQYKYNWFKPNEVKVRTPRDYINLDKTYFESCNEKNVIEWKTKRFFGRKKYYFAKVRIRQGWVSNISSMQACCDTSKLFDCSIPVIGIMPCGTRIKDLMGFRLKSGVWYQEKNRNYYLGASYLFATKHSIIELTGAYLFDNKTISTLSYDYNFFYLPGNIIKAISWTGAQKRHVYSSYFSFYAGTELQAIRNSDKTTVFSQDIHLGLSFQTVYDEFFAPRLFIQHGFGNTNLNSYFSVTNRTTLGVSFLIF